MADEPELAPGAEGDWVTYLQQMLAHLGLFTGEPTGNFDDTTAAAVTAAQQQYGIEEGGTVGESTWKLIAMAQNSGDTAPGYAEIEGTMETVEAPEIQEDGGSAEATA